MATKRFSTEDGFDQALKAYITQHSAVRPEIEQAVAGIITAVRTRGDAAVLEYTRQFDHAGATRDALRVPVEVIDRAYASCPAELRQALERAGQRIEAYHRRQLPEDVRYTDPDGITLGWQWRPVDAVGLYVPGGKAVYPSSVLMNAIPARIAGVKRIAMVVPAPGGEVNPLVLAAAKIADIREVYAIGGAQAVAALAIGTETIPKVDMIVGPGNAYVAAAKRQLFGEVGIDMVAGPSEILVIADDSANPGWLAADLLSQAEHDTDARAILVTDSEALADQVIEKVEQSFALLSRAEMARQSWQENGLVVVMPSLEEAAEVANRLAPEHLELAVEEPDALLPQLRHAGAIFLGHHTPEAVGDYTAGPSHVLPTGGSARFSSGLSVYSFLKRSSLIGCSVEGFAALAEETAALADAEGLTAHALSVRIRK